MLKVYVEPIEKLIDLNNGINTIVIENPILYRKLYFDFEGSFVFSKNDKIIPSNKIITIVNPLEPDINSKKNLSALYKCLESESSIEDKDLLKEIEYKIISLINQIIMKFDINIDFDDELDFNKLFSLMKVRFSNIEDIDYLELLVNYIKIVRELNGTGILVFYGLSSLLTANEYDLLINEIKLLDIQILDICNSKSDNNVFMIVDDDYCII